MLDVLPKPEVVREGLDRAQNPTVSALRLRWYADSSAGGEKVWYLPQDLCLTGPAPERFGLTIQRHGLDDYSLRLIWNEMSLTWQSLRRVQILSSALHPLLRAIGQDLWKLLEQPIQSGEARAHLVA